MTNLLFQPVGYLSGVRNPLDLGSINQGFQLKRSLTDRPINSTVVERNYLYQSSCDWGFDSLIYSLANVNKAIRPKVRFDKTDVSSMAMLYPLTALLAGRKLSGQITNTSTSSSIRIPYFVIPIFRSIGTLHRTDGLHYYYEAPDWREALENLKQSVQMDEDRTSKQPSLRWLSYQSSIYKVDNIQDEATFRILLSSISASCDRILSSKSDFEAVEKMLLCLSSILTLVTGPDALEEAGVEDLVNVGSGDQASRPLLGRLYRQYFGKLVGPKLESSEHSKLALLSSLVYVHDVKLNIEGRDFSLGAPSPNEGCYVLSGFDFNFYLFELITLLVESRAKLGVKSSFKAKSVEQPDANSTKPARVRAAASLVTRPASLFVQQPQSGGSVAPASKDGRRGYHTMAGYKPGDERKRVPDWNRVGPQLVGQLRK